MQQMNIGEAGETALKIKLIKMRDNGIKFNGEMIIDVGYNKNYKSVDNNTYEKAELLFDTDRDALVSLGKKNGIDKASGRKKADVFINGKGYSVKCLAGANPAMINHTSRPGFERVCKIVGRDIKVLDSIIDDYWEWRLGKNGTEDTCVSDVDCPFKKHKEYLRPILEYFFFKGTGSSDSTYPADYLLDYDDPFDETTWQILTKKEAIDVLWEHLVFSVRSKKGMPKNYNPDTYKKPNAESIRRWVRKCDGEYKGALHIRYNKVREKVPKTKTKRK